MCVCVLSRFSRVRFFATPQTAARQAPLSMEFSRQEHWSWLPFPSLGDFPDPGIIPEFPASPALAVRFFTTAQPGKPPYYVWPWENKLTSLMLSFLICKMTA